jgi:hypothetical protein
MACGPAVSWIATGCNGLYVRWLKGAPQPIWPLKVAYRRGRLGGSFVDDLSKRGPPGKVVALTIDV